MAFISDLTQLMRKRELSTRLKSLVTSGDHPSRSVGKSAAALPMETAMPLALFQTEPDFPLVSSGRSNRSAVYNGRV
jgi:hypothetical protein